MMVSFTCMLMLYLGMMMFYLNSKHLLLILITLEFMSLVILLTLINLLLIYFFDMNLLIYFLVFMVCESVLGLVLLTVCVRSHGSDYLKSISLLLC
uniref:NADH-ubiquinone oxidoreductase chain 4L n=1 Tax=Homotoma ficus TaxID=2218120 RepID=A0A344A2F3_9HEMI|nr:NADH dehydrogenase subunit 4L [Homotoma ficus]AWU48944.1 NADH dehydrogenase subunit 4L [Homotoma ficus]